MLKPPRFWTALAPQWRRRLVTFSIIVVTAFILGRLAVTLALNLLLGGTFL